MARVNARAAANARLPANHPPSRSAGKCRPGYQRDSPIANARPNASARARRLRSPEHSTSPRAMESCRRFFRPWQGEAGLLSEPDEGPPVESLDRPERFPARKLGREFLIAAGDIDWLQASGNDVNLRVRGHDHRLRSTIAGIEVPPGSGAFRPRPPQLDRQSGAGGFDRTAGDRRCPGAHGGRDGAALRPDLPRGPARTIRPRPIARSRSPRCRAGAVCC